jgi:hypothetical protein
MIAPASMEAPAGSEVVVGAPQPSHLEGATLVVVATDDLVAATAARDLAKSRGLLVANAVEAIWEQIVDSPVMVLLEAGSDDDAVEMAERMAWGTG